MEPERDVQDDEQFLKNWESQLAKPRIGVFPFVAAFALLCTGFFMFNMRADVAYFLSDVTPLELGAEGSYFEKNALENRYAQLHGIPSTKGWYLDEKEGAFVVVGVNDSPFLVRRGRFQDEAVGSDGKPPAPKQNPFFARGRLISRASASRYESVFAQYRGWSGSEARWILLAEQAPRSNRGVPVSFLFFLIFGVVNAWLLVKGLSYWRRA
jgi:hypothetical protein